MVTAMFDQRECGWLGCGHPKCDRICKPVELDEWLWWKYVQVPTAAYSMRNAVGKRPQSEADDLAGH